jgi:hypothetical protein
VLVSKNIKIDSEIWKAIRVEAAKKDLSIQDYVALVFLKELGSSAEREVK